MSRADIVIFESYLEPRGIGVERWFKWPSLKGRQLQLDVVRCVAILLAMGWHFNHVVVGIAPIDWLISPGRKMGWAGVDLFFVLSGFLIGGLIFAEYKRDGHFSSTRFLVRRVFKIWPVLYLLLAIQLVIHRHPWTTYFIQCLFHVQNYFHTSLDHLWSLAVEEHFYLLFAIGFPILLKFRGNADRMPLVLGTVMVLALVARIVGISLGVDSLDLQTQTQYRIDGLACGVLMAWTRSFRPEVFQALVSRKILLTTVWVANSALLFNFDPASVFMESIGYSFNYIASAAFVLCLFDIEWLEKSKPAIMMAWIGFFSYAMYVFQFVALKPAAALADRLHMPGTTGALVYLVATYGGAFLVAAIVTILVERPMLAVRDWIAPGLKTVPRTDAAPRLRASIARSAVHPGPPQEERAGFPTAAGEPAGSARYPAPAPPR